MKSFLFGGLCLMLWLPMMVQAQFPDIPTDLVPCGDAGQEPCQTCHLYALVQNVSDWFFGLAAMVVSIIIVVSGLRMAVARGNLETQKSARKSIGAAVIGFILIGTSWFIVNFLLTTLSDTPSDGGIFSAIQCVEQPVPQEVEPNDTLATGCADCVDLPGNLPTNGNACQANVSPTGNCQLPPAFAAILSDMHTAAGVPGARITEAWPPTGWSPSDTTGIHSHPCHANGTCVDYGKSGGMSAAEINRVITAARAQNLNPVYEVRTVSEKNALIEQGVDASYISVISRITAAHFSIYGPGG